MNLFQHLGSYQEFYYLEWRDFDGPFVDFDIYIVGLRFDSSLRSSEYRKSARTLIESEWCSLN